MFFMGKSERLKDDFGLLDILSEFCYTIGKQSKGGRQMSVLQKKTEYILMNKDCCVLSFLCIRNEYDEPTFQELQWHVDYRPIGYKTLAGFLERRKAPKHREHIQRLLERFGCDDLEGFLNVTHAVSLNDTFWVKRADRDICWDQVSLYRNEFDQLISEAAFDGSASSSELSTTSPEFGTDGNYAKCWIREDDGIYLYKTGSSRYEVEPLSEFLAAQLAAHICPNYVDYDLDFYRDKLISKCKLFTTEDLGLAKAAGIFTEDRTIPAMLRYFEELGSGDAFRRMCILDALTYNPDRHYGNFGVLFNTDTMEPISMCPVFDNNRSLFPDLDQGQLENPDWYLQKCKPMIGKDFLVTARGLLTPEINSDLKNLLGFRFTQHDRITAPQERLDALSKIVNAQIKAILK